MPEPTDNAGQTSHEVVELHGMWAPGPNAQWKLIGDPIGSGKGFSRAALHRHIVAHHESLHGSDNTSAAEAQEWENAGRGHSQTTFHKKLPGEVKRYIEGNPAARHLFRVTQDASAAGGADAMGDLGDDKYFAHVDRLHGSTLNAALDTARGSNDPEMKFAAMIHDHLPDAAGRKNLGSIDAGKLKTGQSFTYGGQPFKVAEDADGYKVLSGLGEDIPLDALKQVPVDRGSLKAARAPKLKSDDVAPFSGADGPDVYWLHAPTPMVEAKTDRPKSINGEPVKYFWADGITAGDYKHPHKGFQLSVNAKRIDGWISNFRKMQSNGIDVPVVADHSEKAKDSLGYVVGAKREGNTLKLLHQMIGDDAIRMASRNKISLGISPKFKDGRGVEYGDTVIHSALTPVPVVPGQGGLLAASRSQATDNDSNVFHLATATLERSNAMAFTAEQMQSIRDLPGAAEVSEEGAAEWLLSYATSAGTNLVTLAEEKKQLLSRAETAEGQILTLSAAKDDAPKLPDDATLMLLSRAADSEWAGVVAAGHPKALADDFKSLFRDNGKPTVLALSRAHGAADPLEFQIAGLLAKHKSPALKLLDENTDRQHLSMAADPSKDADDTAELSLRKKMTAMANGKGSSTIKMAKMCKDKAVTKGD